MDSTRVNCECQRLARALEPVTPVKHKIVIKALPYVPFRWYVSCNGCHLVPGGWAR